MAASVVAAQCLVAAQCRAIFFPREYAMRNPHHGRRFSPLSFLFQAANYLDIKSLLDLTCKTVADYIKQCKTPQEIRRRFNIKNDFTPEEEEEVRKENAWCEER